jgi:hypothetical protein
MLRDPITRAIGAHGLWKARLREAVFTTVPDFDHASVGRDDRCEFGRWLHLLPASDRASGHFERVRALHEEFHRESAAILELVLEGRREEAERRMAPGQPFERLATDLTAAMIDWSRAD